MSIPDINLDLFMIQTWLTAANPNWQNQSSKQTGDQASNDAVFLEQSAMLQIFILLYCRYIQVLANILTYTQQLSTILGLANIILRLH